jgi:hypothetical protein
MPWYQSESNLYSKILKSSTTLAIGTKVTSSNFTTKNHQEKTIADSKKKIPPRNSFTVKPRSK